MNALEGMLSVGLGAVRAWWGASESIRWYFDEIDIEGRNRIASEFFASIHSANKYKIAYIFPKGSRIESLQWRLIVVTRDTRPPKIEPELFHHKAHNVALLHRYAPSLDPINKTCPPPGLVLPPRTIIETCTKS